jgi:hypothetical protein
MVETLRTRRILRGKLYLCSLKLVSLDGGVCDSSID